MEGMKLFNVFLIHFVKIKIQRNNNVQSYIRDTYLSNVHLIT